MQAAPQQPIVATTRRSRARVARWAVGGPASCQADVIAECGMGMTNSSHAAQQERARRCSAGESKQFRHGGRAPQRAPSLARARPVARPSGTSPLSRAHITQDSVVGGAIALVLAGGPAPLLACGGALDSYRNSSCVSWMVAPARRSSRCCTTRVPGNGSRVGERLRQPGARGDLASAGRCAAVQSGSSGPAAAGELGPGGPGLASSPPRGQRPTQGMKPIPGARARGRSSASDWASSIRSDRRSARL